MHLCACAVLLLVSFSLFIGKHMRYSENTRIDHSAEHDFTFTCGYNHCTWIEPMVVINRVRNRTFDGRTIIGTSKNIYHTYSVSKLDANIKGAAYPGLYCTMSVTAFTNYAFIDPVVSSWVNECMKSAYRLRKVRIRRCKVFTLIWAI